MTIVEDHGEWIGKGWAMTPSGWLYAGLEWFDTYEKALSYIEKELLK
jgi:hypothetical protein